MITLLTCDGTKIGNAIIYGQEIHPELGCIFLIETDFGNKLKLTSREVHGLFLIGRFCSYEEWSADRWSLHSCNKHDDEELLLKEPVKESLLKRFQDIFFNTKLSNTAAITWTEADWLRFCASFYMPSKRKDM